jgi:hypothetical protein
MITFGFAHNMKFDGLIETGTHLIGLNVFWPIFFRPFFIIFMFKIQGFFLVVDQIVKPDVSFDSILFPGYDIARIIRPQFYFRGIGLGTEG